MTCKCTVKVAAQGECLICRRPAEDDPITRAANHASNARTALDDPGALPVEPDDLLAYAIDEIDRCINLLTPEGE